MTERQVSVSRLASLGSRAISDAYRDLSAGFMTLTARAKTRFESRDWAGMTQDAAERLDMYGESSRATAETVAAILGDRYLDRLVWVAMKAAYSAFAMDRQDFELAETYFNSITRKAFATVGVDPTIEFVDTDFDTPPTEGPAEAYRSYAGGPVGGLVRSAIDDIGLKASFIDLESDVGRVSDEIEGRLADLGAGPGLDRLEIVSDVFYRGKGAYLVGRAVSGAATLPLAVAFEHETRGVRVDAVLLTENDVSVLFSFAHSYFHVGGERTYDLVRFVQALAPRKRLSELYISIGRPRHGKTEMFRELLRRLEASDDVFVRAPGQEGLVMSVFTLPGFEMVFKVIKDSFPLQKATTPSQVMDKYRLVFRHDRAGRLVDSQSFEHLQFDADRFEPKLLGALLSDCSRTVNRDGSKVEVVRAYAQRRVVPLDIYLSEAPADLRRAAVIDFGAAIGDLAVTGIFPGDLLIKNFGVTRNGRVVFYDYDELTDIGDCNFREMPVAASIEDEMAETPWFPIGPDDVFPSEFKSFLGFPGELRELFLERHSDLLGAAWWKEIQSRIRDGEIVSIYPYARRRRLGGQ